MRFILLAFILAATTPDLLAQVIIARPLDDITVDGNLDDWPADMERIPLEAVNPVSPERVYPSNLSGSFQVGYHAKSRRLYVGVTVVDDTIILFPERGRADGCTVHTAVVRSDPRMPRPSGPPADNGEGRVVRRRMETDSGVQYEFQIDLDGLVEDTTHVAPGYALAMAVVAYDRDEGRLLNIATWGGRPQMREPPGGRRRPTRSGTVTPRGPTRGVPGGPGVPPGSEMRAPRRNDRPGGPGRPPGGGPPLVPKGTVVFATDQSGSGEIRIRVEHPDGVGARRTKVAIARDQRRPFLVATDASGSASASVPFGKYFISTQESAQLEQIDVQSTQPVDVVLRAADGTGHATPAGPGRRTLAGPGLRQGLWRTYSVLDGLPSPTIFDITQDARGHLWLATANGVACFDGTAITSFTTEDGLCNNTVLSVTEDRAGNVWFGTFGGMSKLHADRKTFTTIGIEHGLSGIQVRTILEDKRGDIWLGTEDGLARLRGTKIETFTAEDGLGGHEILSSLEDQEGRLWFGTGDIRGGVGGTGLITYDPADEKWSFQGGRGRNVGLKTFAIHEQKNGTMWVAQIGNVARSTATGFESVITRRTLREAFFQDILVDSEGWAWLATGGIEHQYGAGGVYRFNTRASALSREDIEQFTTEDGLGDTEVLSIYEDRDGYLWFGTDRGGLSRYDGNRFKHFTESDGLISNDVRDILHASDGSTWFATSSGLSRLWQGEWTAFGPKEGLAYDSVLHLAEDTEGTIWAGTGNTLGPRAGTAPTNYPADRTRSFTASAVAA